jgi:hypothetical protein
VSSSVWAELIGWPHTAAAILSATVLPIPLSCEQADTMSPSCPVNLTSGPANVEAMIALRSGRCSEMMRAEASSHG